MDFRRVDDRLAIAGQITPADVAEISAAGFRSIICNRPDNESPDQPDYEAIRSAADDAGLQTVYIPIVRGIAGADEIEAFRDAMASLPGPVLAYCRTGNRSSVIYDAAHPLELRPPSS